MAVNHHLAGTFPYTDDLPEEVVSSLTERKLEVLNIMWTYIKATWQGLRPVVFIVFACAGPPRPSIGISGPLTAEVHRLVT